MRAVRVRPGNAKKQSTTSAANGRRKSIRAKFACTANCNPPAELAELMFARPARLQYFATLPDLHSWSQSGDFRLASGLAASSCEAANSRAPIRLPLAPELPVGLTWPISHHAWSGRDGVKRIVRKARAPSALTHSSGPIIKPPKDSSPPTIRRQADMQRAGRSADASAC